MVLGVFGLVMDLGWVGLVMGVGVVRLFTGVRAKHSVKRCLFDAGIFSRMLRPYGAGGIVGLVVILLVGSFGMPPLAHFWR
jgi:hypothetical protein